MKEKINKKIIAKKKKKIKKRAVYRSSITGRFVSKKHVKGHPKTTEKQQVRK